MAERSINDLPESYTPKLELPDGYVPSKKEEMLYDLYSNIHDTLSSYRRMIAREGENSLTHDLFQDSLDKEGLDFLEKVISGDQTHSVGIGADSNLRRKAILLHVLYISNLLYEKEAYLKSAHTTDGLLRELWQFVQGDDFYKDNTTFLISTDHGRGTQPMETWKSHGSDIVGADEVWLIAFGKGVSPLGEIASQEQLHTDQIAPTVLKSLHVALKDHNFKGKPILLDNRD